VQTLRVKFKTRRPYTLLLNTTIVEARKTFRINKSPESFPLLGSVDNSEILFVFFVCTHNPESRCLLV